LAQETWAEHQVKLTPIEFAFSGSEPPLSWHLRDYGKRNITNGWDKLPGKQKKLEAIDQFLIHSDDQSVNTTLPTKYLPALSKRSR
jgi:hypothetical protein